MSASTAGDALLASLYPAYTLVLTRYPRTPNKKSEEIGVLHVLDASMGLGERIR